MAFLALLSLIFSATALVVAQPVGAVTADIAVLALSEDCEQTALNKQIDWSGNDTEVIGDMHSNAGITVSGARNDVSGSVTFDDDECAFVLSGSDNTGGLVPPPPAPANGDSVADPAYAVPTAEECTFTFAGAGDTDLASQDGSGGTQDVWLDANTLEPGIYCKTGTGKLQQSKQGVDGHVSFFANGHIDLSNGSNADYTPFRADGVLTHSLADSVDAVTLAGSGTDADNNTFYRGIIYAPNGEAETGGQWITIGCIVAETVKLNGSDHTITACDVDVPDPVIEILKENNTDGPAQPGDEVEFTITVNVTNGPAEGAIITDFLPDGYDDPTGITPAGTFSSAENTITWGPLTVNDGDTFTYTAAVSADTTEEDSPLVNVVFITSPGTNCPPEEAPQALTEVDDPCNDDSTVVVVIPPPPDPFVEIVKENNTGGAPVQPGDEVVFTLTVTITDSNGENVTVEDFIPAGFDDPTDADISDPGTFDGGGDPAGDGGVITWVINSPGDGSFDLTYTMTVSESTADDTELENVAFVTYPGSNCPPLVLDTVGTQGAPVDDPCNDGSTVIVDVPPLEPGLLIDKVADTEEIEISGPADAPVVEPSVVTWTLTFTLTNGPVDNAVITDEVPAGFTFLDASPGGDEDGGVVTWNLGTIDTGGSVSFRTTVDPETIDRVNPTVNVAIIDSDDTDPDEGEDSVSVTVDPPPLGGNPTPSDTVPDTAFGIGIGGETVSVPLELLVVAFIGSLGALTAANVRAWNRRR